MTDTTQNENQDLREQLTVDIFQQTGYKVETDDPFVDTILVCKNIIEQIEQKSIVNINHHLEYNKNSLEDYTNNLIESLKDNQRAVVEEFDSKSSELKELLDTLQNQKDAIIASVYTKMQQRVTEQIEEQLSKDLQAIASNANNKVNNERMLLKGGAGGLIVGIILCAILLFVFK